MTAPASRGGTGTVEATEAVTLAVYAKHVGCGLCREYEERKAEMHRISMALVFVALLVTAPRLTLAFLTGDGIAIPQQIEVMLLTATGIGSGIVLTVGNAILAHALAQKSYQKGLLWYVLLLAWICFLLSAVVVVSPTLVSGLRKSSLITVLPTASAQWFWAIVAVAVIEVLVGASITASILETAQQADYSSGSSALGRLGSALITRLERTLAPQLSMPAVPAPLLAASDQTRSPTLAAYEPGLPSMDNANDQTTPTIGAVNQLSAPMVGAHDQPILPIVTAFTNTQKKQQRQQSLMTYLISGEPFDVQMFAEQHQVSPQTVYRDLKEMQDKMAQAT